MVTGVSLEAIQGLKSYLHSQFTIKDIGEAKYFLGIEIARGTDGTILSQRKYILDIISSSGMLSCKLAKTPLPPGFILSQGDDAPLDKPESYRRLVGQLLYLNFTRPDLAYATKQLSQFVATPTQVHMKAAQHVLRYLKGCPSLGILLPVDNNFELRGFSDADWAACPDTRKSLTGFCTFLGSGLLSWKCKKQLTVSASSAESEYRSLGATVRELTWLVALLNELGVVCDLPVRLACDNMAAIHITKNPVFHERTKHLEVDCHIVCNAFKAGFLDLIHVPTGQQLGDFFTKPLASPRFAELSSKIGLCDIHNVHLAGGC